jgi:hypothetical protein
LLLVALLMLRIVLNFRASISQAMSTRRFARPQSPV